MTGSAKSMKRCFKLFWAWQEEREAQWLQQMALRGWSLKEVQGIRYTFERWVPEKVVYRLDFKESATGELEEYLQLYREAGWECVTRLGNWFYFKRPAGAGTEAELYTDNASRLERYRAQLRMMLIAGLPVYLFSVVLYPPVLYPLIVRSSVGGWLRTLHLLVLMVAAIHAVAVGRIVAIIRRLERDPRE